MAKFQKKPTKRGGPSQAIRDMCAEFIMSEERLRQLMNIFLQEINNGLGKDTHNKASVKCFNTFVQTMPTGTEEGHYLALTFESQRVRVLHIRVTSDFIDTNSKMYEITQRIKYGGAGADLFNFLATCVVKFCEEQEIDYQKIPMAFTFGFPTKQTSLDAGILQHWAKGFHCTDTEGKDVVQMMKRALVRKNAPGIDVVALVNDTTGTMLACAWKNPTCRIGLVISVGYNMCYWEKVSNVELFSGSKTKTHVVINTECGGFGDGGEMEAFRNDFDRELDINSTSPNVAVNEKMLSGLYLGEIVRIVLFKAVGKKLLFGTTKLPPYLSQRNEIVSKQVMEICGEDVLTATNCKKMLVSLGVKQFTDQDLFDVRYICDVVLKRSAYMVAAQLATLVNKMGEELVTVGVDGTLYAGSQVYREWLATKAKQLVESTTAVDFVFSEDGCGKGAALLAAVVVADPPEKVEKADGNRNRKKMSISERSEMAKHRTKFMGIEKQDEAANKVKPVGVAKPNDPKTQKKKSIGFEEAHTSKDAHKSVTIEKPSASNNVRTSIVKATPNETKNRKKSVGDETVKRVQISK